MLDTILLVGKRVLEYLAWTHAGDAKFPASGTAVESHLDILLAQARADIVQDDVICCSATELEPGQSRA